MKQYPENRTYVIFPGLIGILKLEGEKSLARHRLDKQSVVWDYHERDPILKKFKKIPAIKLFTHDQALKQMAKGTWRKPKEFRTPRTLNPARNNRT